MGPKNQIRNAAFIHVLDKVGVLPQLGKDASQYLHLVRGPRSYFPQKIRLVYYQKHFLMQHSTKLTEHLSVNGTQAMSTIGQFANA